MSESSKSSGGYALVTGAARRIGATIATRLHHRGFKVFLHYNGSAEEAISLAETLNEKRQGSAWVVQANLGDLGQLRRLAEMVRAETDQLDLLVNNASRFFPTQAGSTTEEEWDALMDSNLRGPYFLTQSLLGVLARARGSIVNLLDIHANRPMKDHAVYCMAKAGLQMMTFALARELGPSIRVNGVAPGAILWPEQELDEQHQQSILDRVVMGRPGAPEDIASAVVYLGLDAPYVTGQVLAVDGGRSLNI